MLRATIAAVIRETGDRLAGTTKLPKLYLDLTLSPNAEKVIDITGSPNAAATIQSALGSAVPGDKFRVTGTPGTYNWASTVTGVNNGGVGNWITLYVDNANILFNLTGQINGIDLGNKSYYQVANFKIDKSDRTNVAGYEAGIFVGGAFGATPTTTTGHHYRVVNNDVSGLPVGIQCHRSLGQYFAAGNRTFENCWYHPGGGQGMDCNTNWNNASNPNYAAANADPIDPNFAFIIHGNECFNNRQFVGSSLIGQPTHYTDGNGIIFGDHDPDNPTDFHQGPFLASSNLCYYNGGRGIGPYLTANVTVENNTCWHNYQHGVDTNLTGPGNITDPGGAGELGNYATPNLTVRNNYMEADPAVNWTGINSRTRHCYQNFGDDSGRGIFTTFTADCGNNYKVNPHATTETNFTGDITSGTTAQLEDTATLGNVDFRFNTPSPLLNAGKGTPNIAEDFGGNTRVIEGTPDIGAYELQLA